MFSVATHNNGWTVDTLKEELETSLHIRSLIAPINVFSINKNLSSQLQFTCQYLAGGDYVTVSPSTLRLSNTAPIDEHGSNEDIMLVVNQDTMRVFLKHSNTWVNITNKASFGTAPDGKNYVFNIDAIFAQRFNGTNYDAAQQFEYSITKPTNNGQLWVTLDGQVLLRVHQLIWITP